MSPGDEGGSGKFGKVMKWVGYTTAILSLLGAIGGIVKVVANRAETGKQIAGLMSAANVAAEGKDYAAAWQSLEDASKLDAKSEKVQKAREDLAMAWLDDSIRPEPSGKYSGITAKLKPVLERGVTLNKPGPRQADLLAHIGWTYFLESLDETSGLDPAGEYARAIGEDANNPYAQAMWGHLLMWDDADRVDEAEKHFAAGLASNRQADYVRRMQLEALMNHHNERVDAEVVHVANEMRKEHRKVDSVNADEIFEVYTIELSPRDEVASAFVNAVAPAEHLATLHWVFDNLNLRDEEKGEETYFLAVLNEGAGQRDEALRLYRGLQVKPSEEAKGGRTWPGVSAGIKRLTKVSAAKN